MLYFGLNGAGRMDEAIELTPDFDLSGREFWIDQVYVAIKDLNLAGETIRVHAFANEPPATRRDFIGPNYLGVVSLDLKNDHPMAMGHVDVGSQGHQKMWLMIHSFTYSKESFLVRVHARCENRKEHADAVKP